jgi:tetratricopeptide (TPR) repeat protein
MLDSPDALVKLGEVLLQDVEPEAAARAFRSALEVDPHCLAAHRGLYKVHVMLGEPEEARRHLEALRRLEPARPRP